MLRVVELVNEAGFPPGVVNVVTKSGGNEIHGKPKKFGDLVVLMKEGAIVQQGAIPDLIEQPLDPFVTQFMQAQRGLLELPTVDRT